MYLAESQPRNRGSIKDIRNVKLTTRISLFFLVALAVVLAGMSCSIYWLVRGQLIGQVEEFSESALDTLTAAVDFEADGLEWESNVRRLTFAQAPSGAKLVWAVFDPEGHPLDGSRESAFQLQPKNGKQVTGQIAAEDGSVWWVAQRQLRAESAGLQRTSTNLTAKE